MPRAKQSLIGATEIAKKFHISYQLVNYYTNIGLFSIATNAGNRRLYDYHKINRSFKKIRELRRKGYPLRIIRNELLKE